MIFEKNNIKHFSKKISAALIVVMVFQISFLGLQASAAEITVDSGSQEIRIGDQFKVDVTLNTEGEYLNAIEGRLIFPEELIEIKDIRTGSSIINFWIEKAAVGSGNEIEFSGITPGGYIGPGGLIFSAIFQSKNNGSGLIRIDDVRVFRNDGEGTEVNATVSNFDFIVSEEAPRRELELPEIKDIDPPETFLPIIAIDPTVFEGKYFLVFVAQDKGSGIDHYELREGKGDFTIAESPHLLVNQRLDKEITVKAVDKSGNELEVVVPPAYPEVWYKSYSVLATLITVIILLVVAFVVWRIIKRKKLETGDKK